MIPVLVEILTSKKFIVSAVAVAAQIAGHFGFGIDQAAVTTAISPLYLYVVSQAIADHGKSAAVVNSATTPALKAVNS